MTTQGVPVTPASAGSTQAAPGETGQGGLVLDRGWATPIQGRSETMGGCIQTTGR